MIRSRSPRAAYREIERHSLCLINLVIKKKRPARVVGTIHLEIKVATQISVWL